MYNGIIITAIIVLVVIDISVAAIIKKAGLSFWLGLIPVFQFVLLGRIANRFMFGVVVAGLSLLASLLSFYSLSLKLEQYDNIYDLSEPEQTIMVEHQVMDGQGNVISSSVSYEPLDDRSSIEKFLDLDTTPEIDRIDNFNNVIGLFEFVFYVALMYNVCGKFDKGIGFLVGIIILPFIFLPIMAFDNSSYYY